MTCQVAEESDFESVTQSFYDNFYDYCFCIWKQINEKGKTESTEEIFGNCLIDTIIVFTRTRITKKSGCQIWKSKLIFFFIFFKMLALFLKNLHFSYSLWIRGIISCIILESGNNLATGASKVIPIWQPWLCFEDSPTVCVSTWPQCHALIHVTLPVAFLYMEGFLALLEIKVISWR